MLTFSDVYIHLTQIRYRIDLRYKKCLISMLAVLEKGQAKTIKESLEISLELKRNSAI